MAYTGSIKWFSEKKGYGFVLPETGGKDVFLHISGIQGGSPVTEGQKVVYDLGEDRDGKSIATNVRAA